MLINYNIKMELIKLTMKVTCSLLDFLVNGEVVTTKAPVGGDDEIFGTTLVTGGSGDLLYF